MNQRAISIHRAATRLIHEGNSWAMAACMLGYKRACNLRRIVKSASRKYGLPMPQIDQEEMLRMRAEGMIRRATECCAKGLTWTQTAEQLGYSSATSVQANLRRLCRIYGLTMPYIRGPYNWKAKK